MEIHNHKKKRKISFVMPGQGAYRSAIIKNLYDSNITVRSFLKYMKKYKKELLEIMFEENEERLRENVIAQPVIYLSNIIFSTLLLKQKVVPNALAGFSVGEISALALGGAFSIEDGFQIICERARLMEIDISKKHVELIAVFFLNIKVLEEICAKINGVYIANCNSPNQVVVAVPKEKKILFEKEVKDRRGKSFCLKLDAGFHTCYMNEAANKFAKEIKKYEVKYPRIDTYSNLTGKKYMKDVRKAMASQINNKVLWERQIINMYENGINTFIEVGGTGILTNLIREIVPAASTYYIENKSSLTKMRNIIKE